MVKHARLTAVLLVFGLVACDSTLDNAREELRDRARLWQRLGIDDYTFVYHESCFCSPDFTQPWRITVRDNAVVSVVAVADGSPANPIWKLNERTIDEIFHRLQNHADTKNAILDVTYDAQYNFPVRASADIRNAADAGFLTTISSFHID